MRDSLERFNDWRQRLFHELAELPTTLQKIRAGSESFELVGKRLEESTATLEDVTKLYEATMAGTARRSVETADVLRQQLEGLVAESPDKVTGAMRDTMKEMQRTAETLADLNPFWPRRPSSGKSESPDRAEG